MSAIAARANALGKRIAALEQTGGAVVSGGVVLAVMLGAADQDGDPFELGSVWDELHRVYFEWFRRDDETADAFCERVKQECRMRGLKYCAMSNKANRLPIGKRPDDGAEP
ncbi:hypothetical protein [Rhodoblastus sp.]|uniref:hypothetical protein n=1 Tax=Rhodoblastus sp. TaxID=1962975 RepID=UPI003F99965F